MRRREGSRSFPCRAVVAGAVTKFGKAKGSKSLYVEGASVCMGAAGEEGKFWRSDVVSKEGWEGLENGRRR